MNVLAITQARSGSTRLPGKVLKTIGGKSLLEIHIERILKSKKVEQLLVATTTDPADDLIEKISVGKKLPVYRGSMNDVLDRFYRAALPYKPVWVVRLTSDCPLIDPELIDSVINKAIELKVDYCSNVIEPSFPDGEDIEVMKFTALEKAWKEANANSDREHVTPYIYKNSNFHGKTLYTAYNYSNVKSYAQVRLTVDELKDFEVIKLLIENLGSVKDWKTYADYYLNTPSIKQLNSNIKRNEGYIQN